MATSSGLGGDTSVQESRQGLTEGLLADGDRSSSARGCSPSCGLVSFLRGLRAVFGWRLLASLCFSQHILIGLLSGGGVGGYIGTTLPFYYRALGGVSASSINIYCSVANTPWSLKTIFSMLSDAFPILGFHKRSYLYLTSVVAMAGYALVTFLPVQSMNATLATFAFFAMVLQLSMAHLLSEASYAPQIKAHPDHGPALLSYVWGGIFALSIVCYSTIGTILENLCPRWVYAISWPFAALLFVPIMFNWFQESPAGKLCSVDYTKLCEHREIFYCSLVLGAIAMVFSGCGMGLDEEWERREATLLVVAFFCSAIVMVAFWICTPRPIALMAIFFFVQKVCHVNTEGAQFYFYTDTEEAFPSGPNFSTFYYTTAVGLVGAAGSVLITVAYNRFMSNWHFWTVFRAVNVLYILVCLLSAINFSRVNVKWGVPDEVFVFGSLAMQDICTQFTWIPGMLLASQVCPVGLEATTISLLAVASNLGGTVSSFLGAYLFKAFGVEPTGGAREAILSPNGTKWWCEDKNERFCNDANGYCVGCSGYDMGFDLLPQSKPPLCFSDESASFEQLYIVALIAAAAPLIPIAIVSFLIPDARQTDRLRMQPAGSLPDATMIVSIVDPNAENEESSRGKM